MKKHLNILLVETVQDDIIQLTKVLKNSFSSVSLKLASTKEEFVHQIEADIDLIISAYFFPAFNGLELLDIKNDKRPELPFVILTDSQDEATAVACMKAGADDYVLKKNRSRIPLVIKKAIESKSFAEKLRREQHHIEYTNRVLRSIRRVNKIIFHERNINNLLQQTVDALVDEASAKASLVMLTDKMSNKQWKVFKSGFDISEDDIMEEISNSRISPCIMKSLNESMIMYFRREESFCSNCILFDDVNADYSFTIRLEYDGNVFGVLLVVLPDDVSTSEEDNSFFKEVGEEISLAIHNLNTLKEKNRYDLIQKSLIEIAETALGSSDFSDLLGKIHQSVGKFMDVSNFYVALYRKETKTYDFPYFKDAHDEIRSFKDVDRNKGITDYVRRKAKALYADSTVQQQLVDSGEIDIIGHPAPIWMGFPMKIGNEVVGVLAVQNYENANAFSQSDMNLLSYISAQVAGVIIKKELSDRLAENEEKFRKAFETTPDAISILNAKTGKVLDVNQGFVEMTGYEKHDLLKNELNSVHTTDNKTREKIFSELNNSGVIVNREIVIRDKNGKSIPILFSASTIEVRGEKYYLFISRNIEEIKRAEEALKNSEENLKTLINATPDIIVFKDGKGRWLVANDADISLFELEKVSYFGKTDNDLSKESPYYSDALRLCVDTDEKAWSSKKPTRSYEVINVRDKGERIFDIIKVPLFYENGERKALLVYGRDVTVQQRMEAELQDREMNYRLLFEHSPLGIITAKPDGTILEMNHEILNIIGSGSIDASRKFNLLKLPNLFESGFTDEFLNACKTGETTRFEGEYKSVWGKSSWVSVQIVPLKNEKGEVEKIYGVFDDTTIRKEYEIALLTAKEKAEESDRLKSEFLSNMSHEIRTPMNGIIGFSELLLEESISSESRRNYVKIVINSTRQLLRIIDDILEISKLETHQVPLHEREICINDLLTEIFAVFDLKAKEKKLSFHLKKGLNDQAATIIVDDTKLRKILDNLIENALKFTHEGYVELGYEKKARELEIYVKDTGVGIGNNNFNTIFERFSQEEKELSRKVGGLGLGLSIAKANAELLKGFIRVESEKGKGATFYITIPYHPVKTEVDFLNDRYDDSLDPDEVQKVLIVEDEEINYQYIEFLLKHMGYSFRLLRAVDGEQAVELCKENTDISLVLMDVKLPKLNGHDATKKIKGFRPDLKVIAQTAYATVEDRDLAIEAGCDDFISKPFQKQEFYEMIVKYISHR
ncbi:MAG: PAS domain S-box protein [Bacteroidales bacterium]|nr:PAS domain S-box protein [Bacteroidales bacterium]